MAAGNLVVDSCDEDLDEDDDIDESVTPGGLMHQLGKNPTLANKNMSMLSVRIREADNFMNDMFPALD